MLQSSLKGLTSILDHLMITVILVYEIWSWSSLYIPYFIFFE